MPIDREIVFKDLLTEGQGTMQVTSRGALRAGEITNFAPVVTYPVLKADGTTTERELAVGGLPWSSAGERVTFKLRNVTRLRDNDGGVGSVMGLSLVAVNADGATVSSGETGRVVVGAEDGAFLYTNDDRLVAEGLAGDAVLYPGQEPNLAQPKPAPSDDEIMQVDGLGLREDASVTKLTRTLSYTPDGVAVTAQEVGWSSPRWNGAPPSDATRLTLTNTTGQRIAVGKITLRTPYGIYVAEAEATGKQPRATPARVEFHWTTSAGAMPFLFTTHISKLKVNYTLAVPNSIGASVYQVSDLADITAEVQVTSADGRVLATGSDVGFEGGRSITLSIRGTSPYPIEIQSVQATCTVDRPSDSDAPAPIKGGAVYVNPDSGGPTPYASAAVPAGARRIMRHPLMSVGATCRNQAGLYCAWESAGFLLLPAGTTRVSWGPAGNSVSQQRPRADLPTAKTWGDCEIAATNEVPSDLLLETDSGSTVRTYSPEISVVVGGIDATLDLTSAGGLSASYEGGFDQIAGGPQGIDGADFIITLDGVVIEWGKVVGYRVSSTEEGSTVEVTAVDPLEYHNVDLDTLYNHQASTVDPRKDLGGYAQDIASHAGLTLSNMSAATFPVSDADTEGDDPYTAYGNTVTQELELVANAGMCTVVTDAPSQSIMFMPLGAQVGPGHGGAPSDKSCAFIGQGFNLAEGYAVVEVSGVSNTVRVDTKSTPLPVIRVGSNGMNDDNATKVLTFTGNGTVTMNDGEDASRWWPGADVEHMKPFPDGNYWIEFSKIGEGGEPALYPVPLRFNLSGDGDKGAGSNWAAILAGIGGQAAETDILKRYAGGGVIKLGEPGAPTLNWSPESGKDPRLTYWIENKTGLSWASGPFSDWKIGEQHEGDYLIDDIEFKVETPAQIRARKNLKEDLVPDSLGPCVTAFRCHIRDEGMWGYSVYFRLPFKANVIDEGRISLLPFVCAPSSADTPGGRLPHKKVTIQNPFIVQERPKDTEWGSWPDLTKSPAYQRGVQLATKLTQWEAVKRHSGEVKCLGGKGGRIGEYIEGQLIIAQPSAQIVPGEACWTIFKTSSY